MRAVLAGPVWRGDGDGGGGRGESGGDRRHHRQRRQTPGGVQEDGRDDAAQGGQARIRGTYYVRCRAYIFPVVINFPIDVSAHAR